MVIAEAEQVKEILLNVIAEDSFSPETHATKALYRCVFPGKPLRELRRVDVSAESRVAVEQHIHGFVYTLGHAAQEAKTLMMEYTHPLSSSRPAVPSLFDIVLSLGDSNFLEPGFIFTLIERLVEMMLVPEECHKLIDWIVGNKRKLKREHIFDRGKLILLRTVNRMLKVLQRGDDCTYHSGRLLFFMSELYPIAERSATNHSGLRDMAHPVKTSNWTDAVYDDFGRLVDKSVYELYWKTMEYVQRTVGSESEAVRTLDTVHRLLDFFRSHPCRRDVPTSLKSCITLMNDTIPEKFNEIIRDPDSRMECIVQMYIYIQRLLSAFKNPVVTSDAGRQRLSATLQDIEHYVRNDSELKQRWGSIYECLQQETSWIEWKNADAKDWSLQAKETSFWNTVEVDSTLEQDLSNLHACLENNDQNMSLEMSSTKQKQTEQWDMKASKGIHIHFDRNLELPDFDELRVPNAKEFLGNVLSYPDEMAEQMEILESDMVFCWRTYRLLSEHDINHMVNADHRTNFAQLLNYARQFALSDGQ